MGGGVNFINKYQNLVISNSGKKSFKIVKIEVENFVGSENEISFN